MAHRTTTKIRRGPNEYWYRMRHHPDVVISTVLTVRYICDGSPHPLQFEQSEPGAVYSFIHGCTVDSITRDWLFVSEDRGNAIVAFSMKTGKRLATVMPGDNVDHRTQVYAIDERPIDARRTQVRVVITNGFVPPVHPDGTVYVPERDGNDTGYPPSNVRLLTITIDTETEEAEVLPPQLITGAHDPNNLLTAGRRVLRFPQDLGLPHDFAMHWSTQSCFSPDGRSFAIRDFRSNDVYVTDTVARTLLFKIDSVVGFSFLSPTLLGVGAATTIPEQANFMIVSVPLGGRVVFRESLGMTQSYTIVCDDRDDGEEFGRHVVAEGLQSVEYDDAEYDVFCRFDRAAAMNELPNGDAEGNG